jgi:hypothetical protein
LFIVGRVVSLRRGRVGLRAGLFCHAYVRREGGLLMWPPLFFWLLSGDVVFLPGYSHRFLSSSFFRSFSVGEKKGQLSLLMRYRIPALSRADNRGLHLFTD